ncbi:hypothetical protein [Halomarina pelagica]|uniref:hypothetical protein n=1 Tax=Halomarina pelagica TaxID=2961599 RepID=UPI0020C2DF41|nr:hypothetical protein [Halomarina sp. BND7]
MTETPRSNPKRRTDERTHRPTLGELSHTNPYTDEAFGETIAYERGPAVAADGGRDPSREGSRSPGRERLRDVSHEPPHGEGANRVHERGEEAEAEERRDRGGRENRGESA